MEESVKHKKTYSILFTLLPFIPVFIFSFYVLSNFQNFPNADDFDSLLDFLNRFVLGESTYDSLALLFERHTQHFRTPDRIFALFTYLLTGGLNFYFFSFLGLSGLCITFFLLARSTKKPSYPLLPLVLALIFFQPTYVEATQWANNCVQFIWINVFALLSFIYFRKNPFLTLLFSVCAILTQGNGICILPSIILFLIYKREFNKTLFFYLVSLVVILLAFNFSSLTSSGNKLNITSEFIYALEMLGSSIGYYSKQVSFITGSIIAILSAFLVLKVKREEEYLILFLLFLCGSCLATAHFRLSLDPKSSYTTSRYTLMSVLAIVSILKLSEKFFVKKPFLSTFLLIPAFLFSVQSYKLLTDQYYLRKELIQDSMIRWHLFKKGLLYKPELRAEQILEHSIQLKTFTPKEPEVSTSEVSQVLIPEESADSIQGIWSIEHKLCSDDYLLIDGWVTSKHSNAEFQNMYLEYAKIRYKGEQRHRPDVNLLLAKSPHKVRSRKSGFFFLIPRNGDTNHDFAKIVVVNNTGNWSQRKIPLEEICPPSS